EVELSDTRLRAVVGGAVRARVCRGQVDVSVPTVGWPGRDRTGVDHGHATPDRCGAAGGVGGDRRAGRADAGAERRPTLFDVPGAVPGASEVRVPDVLRRQGPEDLRR